MSVNACNFSCMSFFGAVVAAAAASRLRLSGLKRFVVVIATLMLYIFAVCFFFFWLCYCKFCVSYGMGIQLCCMCMVFFSSSFLFLLLLLLHIYTYFFSSYFTRVIHKRNYHRTIASRECEANFSMTMLKETRFFYDFDLGGKLTFPFAIFNGLKQMNFAVLVLQFHCYCHFHIYVHPDK